MPLENDLQATQMGADSWISVRTVTLPMPDYFGVALLKLAVERKSFTLLMDTFLY